MEKYICAECEGEFFFVNGVAHHYDEDFPDGIDYEMDAHHVAYSEEGSSNGATCSSCGGERTCNEDGQVSIGEACPLCGHMEVDYDSLRGAGLAFSGYGRGSGIPKAKRGSR